MNAKLLAGLAKGVIGLVTSSDLVKALGNPAIEGACETWLESDPTRKLLEGVSRRLEAAGERGETDRGDVLGKALSEALRRRGYLVTALLRDRGDSRVVAADLVAAVDRDFDLTEREAALCRAAASAFLDQAIDDPRAIPGMEAEWRRAVLASVGAIADQLARLPDEVQRASRRLLVSNLVAIPAREVFDPAIKNPYVLLNPSYRTVDLIGREAISEGLLRWCEGPSPLALTLIADEHGAGKTRLCIDLCERLAGRGWRTGFAGAIPASSGIERWVWPELFATPAPVFVVMDYANRRTEELKVLLAAALSAATAGRPPIRIVLTSWRAVEWWTRLEEQVGDEVRSLLTGPAVSGDPVEVPRLSPESRAALYRGAVRSIAARLGRAAPDTTVPDLDTDLFRRPAFIMMAALAAVEGIPPRWRDALALLRWTMSGGERCGPRKSVAIGGWGKPWPRPRRYCGCARAAVVTRRPSSCSAPCPSYRTRQVQSWSEYARRCGSTTPEASISIRSSPTSWVTTWSARRSTTSRVSALSR